MSPQPSSTRWRTPARAVMACLVAVAAVVAIAVPGRRVAADVAPSWTTRASVSIDVLVGGQSLALSVDVMSATTVTALVDLEIYDDDGNKVYQHWWDVERLIPERLRSFTTTWPVPVDQRLGQYTVKIGVFNRGWAGLLHWNDDAESFSVASTPLPSDSTTTEAATNTTHPATPTTSSSTTTSSTTTTTTIRPSTTSPATTVPVPAPTPTTVPSGTQFFEDFSSPAALNRFQFQVHRDIQLPPPTEWHGDHAMSCGGPDETRVIDRDVVPDESIYFCAPKGPDSGHFMTSMMTQGYAQIDFSPQQVFTNVSKICWDMNQTEMGGRKWVDVVVIKEATYQANGGKLFYALPGFDVSIAGGGIFFGDQDNFMLSMFEGSTETYNGQIGYPTGNRNDDDGFTTTDKARRYRNCMTDNGNGTISFELERDSGVARRTLDGSFPDGPARVIFADATYDPFKGDHPDPMHTNTWHWDNITIH